RLARRGPRRARGGRPLLSAGAGAVARLRRRALQPGRRAGPLRPRRRGHRALAALSRARRRQPVGAHRARPSGSPRPTGGAQRMKVLLVGGGGREHALAWKIAQSPLVEHMWAAPGNPGIARHARCLDLAADDADGLAGFAAGHDVDLVVVGPEQPLVAGLADALRAKGLAVFGPSRRAAAIEGSKAFAKRLMAGHGIPTARFATFDDPVAARRYARELGAPCVVKTDGLAAGKGAIVCATLAEADTAIAQCMERREFGAAGATVVIEEFMCGEEASFFALVSDTIAVPLDAAQDHKTVFDDDRGPNTGGMGAFAPAPPIDGAMQARIMREIVDPTVAALAAGGAPYRGVLYVGLMLTKEGPTVVEFNCRFGDPESQPMLARMDGDLLPPLFAVARGERPSVAPWA